MKAKIKETGKWVTVNPCNVGFYDVNTHDIYDPDELDFAAELDWQAFRREAAKDILCALLTGNDGYQGDGENESFAKQAIGLADELVRQLQEK